MASKRDSESHAPGEVFEAAGRTLLLAGTSGPAEAAPRVSDGEPIRHDLVVGGRNIDAAGTSGASPFAPRLAEGRPAQHTITERQLPLTLATGAAGATGRGEAVGGPVRHD